MGPEKLLTLQEVAEIIKVSTKWMYRHIKDNTAPNHIRVGKYYHFSPISVQEYQKKNSIAARDDYEVHRRMAKRQKSKEVAQ
jgi:predicted DNA-binding transcriptional regulator AlpA